MLSIWQKQSFHFSTDVIIVGAGLTGLLTAIKLRKSNPLLTVRILEKGSSPSGATVKNAGFACFGSVSEIIDDMRAEGESSAFERVLARSRGLQLLFDTIEPHKIDLRRNGGMEIFTENEKELLEESLSSIDFINSRLKPELGFEPFSAVSRNFGFNALRQAIAIRGESTLNSGKLMLQLLQTARNLDVEINFGAEVEGCKPSGNHWELETPSGEFRCTKVLIATNGFTSTLLPTLPILPARGQVVVTSKIPDLELKHSFHLHQGYFYFRELDGAVLLGGGRHLDRHNETTTEQGTTPLIQDTLEKLLRETILPGKEFTIEHRWAGTMAFGPNNEKEPIVTEVEPNLFVAARLGGMGVAMSSLVAEKANNLILNT